MYGGQEAVCIFPGAAKHSQLLVGVKMEEVNSYETLQAPLEWTKTN